jgi:hypothetical protein
MKNVWKKYWNLTFSESNCTSRKTETTQKRRIASKHRECLPKNSVAQNAELHRQKINTHRESGREPIYMVASLFFLLPFLRLVFFRFGTYCYFLVRVVHYKPCWKRLLPHDHLDQNDISSAVTGIQQSPIFARSLTKKETCHPEKLVLDFAGKIK